MSKEIIETDKIQIKVYLQDGRVFKYYVEDSVKAREHAHRIINYGWRNAVNGVMEYYPVHQVLKVAFPAPNDEMIQKYEQEAVQYTNLQPLWGEDNMKKGDRI